MDDVHCNGNETEISDCRFGGWGKSDCDATEAAGVICSDTESVETHKSNEALEQPQTIRINKNHEIDLRLFGGRNDREGQVEVCFWERRKYNSYISEVQQQKLFESNMGPTHRIIVESRK